MAKEYIEREVAIAKCNKLLDNVCSCPNPLALEGVRIVRDLILTDCKTGISAADVVEVRHGEWCLVEYEYLTCSECGESYYTGCESTAEAKERLQNGEVPNYCPHCGADMRGEKQWQL